MTNIVWSTFVIGVACGVLLSIVTDLIGLLIRNACRKRELDN